MIPAGALITLTWIRSTNRTTSRSAFPKSLLTERSVQLRGRVGRSLVASTSPHASNSSFCLLFDIRIASGACFSPHRFGCVHYKDPVWPILLFTSSKIPDVGMETKTLLLSRFSHDQCFPAFPNSQLSTHLFLAACTGPYTGQRATKKAFRGGTQQKALVCLIALP